MEKSTIISSSREQLHMVKLVPNTWNNFENAAKKAGHTHNLKDTWGKMSHEENKVFTTPEKEHKIKTNVTCCIKTFTKLVKDCKLASLKILEDSPFFALIKLANYEVNEDFAKEIADSFDLYDKSFTVCGTKYTLHVNDFDDILNITDGNDELIDVNRKPSDDLIKKFCFVNDKKLVSINLVKKILKERDQENDDDVKRAFALAVLRYIVCPPSCGKLESWTLNYVEDLSSLKEKPWATLAMQSLLKGIKTYQNRKGKRECYLGGSTVFLQLYYLSKAKNMRPELSISLGNKETAKLLKFDEVKKITLHGVEEAVKDLEIFHDTTYEVGNENKSRTSEQEDNLVILLRSNQETPSRSSEQGYFSVNSKIKMSNSSDAYEILNGKEKGVSESSFSHHDELIEQFRAMRVTRDNEVEIMRKKFELEEKKEERKSMKMSHMQLNTLLAKENLLPEDKELKRHLLKILYGM